MHDVNEPEKLRTRAALARRLASELNEPNASQSLEEIADALDSAAAALEAERQRHLPS